MSEFLDSLTASLAALVEEAREHRAADPPPDAEAPPHELHAYLLGVRARLDRVEAILATLYVRRGEVRSRLLEAEEIHEEAFDQAAVRFSPGQDFMAGRERLSHVNVAVISQARTLRTLKRAQALVDGYLDAVKTIHRGLDSLRFEVDSRIRSITLETRLET